MRRYFLKAACALVASVGPLGGKSHQTSTPRKGGIAPIPARRAVGLAGAMITEYPLDRSFYFD